MIYLRITRNSVDICENKDFFGNLHRQDDTKTSYDKDVKNTISCNIPRVIRGANELVSLKKHSLKHLQLYTVLNFYF